MGAAATVPSAVGIISQFFVGRERNYALAIFGACGAVSPGQICAVLGRCWGVVGIDRVSCSFALSRLGSSSVSSTEECSPL